jgi:hypothetical protein
LLKAVVNEGLKVRCHATSRNSCERDRAGLSALTRILYFAPSPAVPLRFTSGLESGLWSSGRTVSRDEISTKFHEETENERFYENQRNLRVNELNEGLAANRTGPILEKLGRICAITSGIKY